MLKKKLKLLRNQKGLTLVELLAVIVILGVIAAIAVPTIGGLVKDTKAKADQQTEALIRDAAERYAELKLNTSQTPQTVLVGNATTPNTLVGEGYLKFKPERQRDGKAYLSVEVTYDSAKGIWTAGTITVEQ